MNSDAAAHYDLLIDENNDPVHDPEPLKRYMEKWDGRVFIDALQCDSGKDVLEIGVGTGRLAVKVAPNCRTFTGIDISPKTIARAKENLAGLSNIILVCDDFMTYRFDRVFDVVYSSLTFMHIEHKQAAINKIAGLLAPGGRFVLSISKSQNNCIDIGTNILRVFPDHPDDIRGYMEAALLLIENRFETEFAYIFAAAKA